MAQKYIVQLVDDLTNELIEDGSGESVTFALDGVGYTIDLTSEHAYEFRSALSLYVSSARKADAASSKVRSAVRGSSAAPKSDLKDVRDWASSNGFAVSSRGRIPANVQEAYAAAH
ncbi:Lsr2 family protein [uncultured Amnibacterium sp.]|uniref:histone-like nucleoid-structuring protein Lsr2 n=1 Tax=uncultured Amnibacterium sp. TaxID=1631851 RepID=UPI0035CB40BF